jgi:hypothetical protein
VVFPKHAHDLLGLGRLGEGGETAEIEEDNGCAITLGASTMVASATAATAPLAFTMNLRRLVVTLPSSLGAKYDAVVATRCPGCRQEVGVLTS